MPDVIKIKNLHLAHTKDGVIKISHIEHPFGKYSDPVVSIGMKFHKEDKTEHLEIPYDNLDDLILALQRAKEVSHSIIHEDVHGELMAEMGGGQ